MKSTSTTIIALMLGLVGGLLSQFLVGKVEGQDAKNDEPVVHETLRTRELLIVTEDGTVVGMFTGGSDAKRYGAGLLIGEIKQLPDEEDLHLVDGINIGYGRSKEADTGEPNIRLESNQAGGSSLSISSVGLSINVGTREQKDPKDSQPWDSVSLEPDCLKMMRTGQTIVYLGTGADRTSTYSHLRLQNHKRHFAQLFLEVPRDEKKLPSVTITGDDGEVVASLPVK